MLYNTANKGGGREWAYHGGFLELPFTMTGSWLSAAVFRKKYIPSQYSRIPGREKGVPKNQSGLFFAMKP
jgi:hypothetical protein